MLQRQHSPKNGVSESLPQMQNEAQKNSNRLVRGFTGRSWPQMSMPQTSHVSLEKLTNFQHLSLWIGHGFGKASGFALGTEGKRGGREGENEIHQPNCITFPSAQAAQILK